MIAPTKFHNNIYNWNMYDTDFFYSRDGTKQFPNHHCKVTWVASEPFIKLTRNSIDIGCRDGEYTRYLHKIFDHVYCFDYRDSPFFSMNVDLSKITHYKCALGEINCNMKVSGAGNMTDHRIPKNLWYDEQVYTLDEFNLTNIDYIKIDVDGHEKEILYGARNTIKSYMPLIVAEQENEDTSAIEYCKQEFNYKILSWDKSYRNVILGP